MKFKFSLPFIILFFHLLNLQGQEKELIQVDSLTYQKFVPFIDSMIRQKSDSVLWVNDSVDYKLRFMVSGGYSTHRGRPSMNLTSIQLPPNDSLIIFTLLPIKQDSLNPKYSFNPCDSFFWGHQFEFARTNRTMLSSTYPCKFPISRNNNIPSISFSWNPLGNSFDDGYYNVTSFENGRYLLIVWPLILQYGGETDWGMQNSWFLERME